MKKIFTTLALAFACVAPSFAALTVTHDGKAIEYGDVVTLSAEDFKSDFPGIVPFGAEAIFNMTTDAKEVNYTATADCEYFQYCYGVNCYPISKVGDEYTLSGTMPGSTDIQIHVYLSGGVLPETSGEMQIILDNGNESDMLAFTVKFDTKPAGVEGLETAVKASYRNNVLTYSLDAPATLAVYSITGAVALNRTVSGNGSVDFSTLPKGIYVYTLGGKANKVLVK